jgi:hypothetical protein
MKALRNHASRAVAAPLVADDVLEFHAGRLMLLLTICGGPGATINGLTKLAKLDFFVRYPDFFAAVTDHAGRSERQGAVEAAMVRHHYGPWDKRYYHVLAFLEARGLITVKQVGKAVRLSLTRAGKKAAATLEASGAFQGLTSHMRKVAAEFSSFTGNELKSLIYATFGEDVSDKPLGHVIGSAPT